MTASNAAWQRTLAVSYAKIGLAHAALDQLAEARAALENGRAIIAALLEKFPDHFGWKGDLAWFEATLAALPN